MKLKLLSLIILVVTAAQYASSQDNQFKEPIPRTPNAASLGKYGDIPVSYHTGVPSISIPIYTVVEGELTLPISVSYHSSGIKVNETASWVGLGWSLNAGGMISRTVMGGHDEGLTGTVVGNKSSGSGWGWYSDYGQHPNISNPCNCNQGSWDCHPNDPYPSGFDNCKSHWLDAANGFIDTEPDIFSYNFGGLSGRFVFDENRQAHTIPREDILIEPANEDFISWKITIPDGTKYYFGESGATEKGYTYSRGTGEIQPQYNTSTTWYLYRIESVNGNRWIELAYESEDYSVADRLSHTAVTGNGTPGVVCTGSSGDLYNAEQSLMVNSIQGKRLSQITTSSGNVILDFIATNLRQDLSEYRSMSGYDDNDEAKYLDEIRIKNEDETVQKKFVFDIDYFTSSSSSSYPIYTCTHDTKRLRLNFIQEFSGDGLSSKPPYVFTYNSTQMARRLSLGMDYWGYYNGNDNNYGLVPNGLVRPCEQTSINTGDYRNVNTSDTKAWILEKIEYPTGGDVSFEYEGNKYLSGSTNYDIGGLRIHKITKTYGNNQPNVVLEYEYSDGVLYSKNPYTDPTGFFFTDPCTNLNMVYIPSCTNFGYLLNATPQSPAYSCQSYLIGYREVKELNADGSYTQYNYTSLADLPWDWFPRTPQQNPIGNGRLNSTEHKDDNDQTIQSNSNSYYSGGNVFVNAIKIATVNDYNPPNGQPSDYENTYAVYNDYQISTRRDQILTETIVSDGVSTLTTYSYDPTDKHGNPIATEVIDSNDKTVKNEFLYPSDAGSGAPVQMYDVTNANYKHMPGVLIQQTTKVENNPVSKVLHNYAYDSGADEIHPTSTVTYPSGGTDYNSVSYGFDDYENIETITKPDGIVDSYYWGYNHSLPVAKIINAEINNTYENISTTKTVQNYYSNDISWTNIGTPLVLDHEQSLAITITFEQYSGTNAHCEVQLKKPDDTFDYIGIFYPGNPVEVNTLELPAGSYQYQCTVETGTAPQTFLKIETDYEYMNIENNIIYESFEEDENASTAYVKTGERSKYGAYTLPIYADPGTYILSYWQKSSSSAPWVYHETELVNPPDTYSIASSGQYTDEIRFYPKGAQMETYTHDPGSGITSITDINNQTRYYEYDDLGRLVKVIDSDGNLIQEVEYNYTNQ